MKNYFYLLLLSFLIACKSLSIHDKKYKVCNDVTELASIGFIKTTFLKSNFSTRVFPKLENKIRVDVKLIPFTKAANKIYLQKSKYNQSQTKIKYIDSLSIKPELVKITILDLTGYMKELNSEYNSEVITFLKNTQKSKIVTSIVTTLSTDSYSKIMDADAYYIVNNQDKKYTLALYKLNKKTETIDLNSSVIIAYQLSRCCWAINKGRWNLSDIEEDCKTCNGNTFSKIKVKEESKSLFKM
jgi:hypothetical protein